MESNVNLNDQSIPALRRFLRGIENWIETILEHVFQLI